MVVVHTRSEINTTFEFVISCVCKVMTNKLGIQFLAQEKDFSLPQGVQTGSELTWSTVQWEHAAISLPPQYLHGVVLNCAQGQFYLSLSF